jgi:hypothetical protein
LSTTRTNIAMLTSLSMIGNPWLFVQEPDGCLSRDAW